jgi:hypothetical protein
MIHGLERPRDVAGGLLVVAIGAGFLLVGRELEMGTSFRMGPGYFPTLLGGLMILLGAVLTALAWRAPHQEGAFGHVPWRGLLLVVGSVLFFGLSLRGLGLAPVLALVVLASAWASQYASWRASVPLALGLAVFCVALFLRGLGLPLPTVGPWLSPAYWSAPPAVAPPAGDATPAPPAQ